MIPRVMASSTMICNRRRFLAYRGLVALNNLGVRHMEKRRCPEALEALKCALLLHHTYTVQDVSTEDMSAMISCMTSSISRPEQLTDPGNKSRVDLSTPYTIKSLTFSPGFWVNIPGSASERRFQFTANMVASPIRVEVEDLDLDPSDDSLNLQIAIILHNLATASLCTWLNTAFTNNSGLKDTNAAYTTGEKVSQQQEIVQRYSALIEGTNTGGGSSVNVGQCFTVAALFSVDKARRICALFQASLNLVELICVNRMNIELSSSFDGTACGNVADVATLEAAVLTSMIPLMNVAALCPRDGHNFEASVHAATVRLTGLREELIDGYEMVSRYYSREACAGAA